MKRTNAAPTARKQESRTQPRRKNCETGMTNRRDKPCFCLFECLCRLVLAQLGQSKLGIRVKMQQQKVVSKRRRLPDKKSQDDCKLTGKQGKAASQLVDCCGLLLAQQGQDKESRLSWQGPKSTCSFFCRMETDSSKQSKRILNACK
jgi:hypothetical protein